MPPPRCLSSPASPLQSRVICRVSFSILLNAKLTHESYGDQRIYFDGSTEQLRALTVGWLALKAGMVPHPPHQHPEEEIMLVTDGSGEITVEGKPHRVAAGSMMYCAGQRMHGITAGAKGLTFYFYKWSA